MLEIRDAVETDLPAMAELLLIVHQMHVTAQPDTYGEISREAAVEFLATRLADDSGYLRVAEIDSNVQGYCCAVMRKGPAVSVCSARSFLYVNEIVVRPERRKSGIGRALIADLKEFARQSGVTEIELDVGSFNSAARDFFQAQGFYVLRERMRTEVESE